MPSNGQERRRSPREACDGPAEVTVSQPHTVLHGELRDIGQHGCFVATGAAASSELNSPANLRFHLGGREYSTMAQIARVRSGEGLGLEFQFSNGFTRKVARAMIERLQHRQSESQLGHHLFHYGNLRSDA